eukprot:3326672-Lingulodinium_polyedra.AAC.1
MVRVVAVCSGIESVIQAYENLGLARVRVAVCEKDRHRRSVIDLNFSPRLMFKDVCELQPHE